MVLQGAAGAIWLAGEALVLVVALQDQRTQEFIMREHFLANAEHLGTAVHLR
jgi:hypothetical protein